MKRTRLPVSVAVFCIICHSSRATRLNVGAATGSWRFAKGNTGGAKAAARHQDEQPVAADTPQAEVIAESPPAATQSDVYRPFAVRFQAKPANESSPSFALPENRHAYQKYVYAHPRHALSTTSIDRNAESDAVLVGVVAAFSLVLCVIVAMDRLQYLPPEKQLSGILLAGAIPWCIATGWVFQVALRHFRHPMRDGMNAFDEDGAEWQCDALVFFLLVLPFISAAAAISQVLSMRQSVIPEDTDKQAPMGRMFDSQFTASDSPGRKLFIKILWFMVQPSVRYTLIALALSTILFGWFVVLFGGRGGELCQPEVWWTSVVLVAGSILALVLAVFSVLGCFAVFYVSGSEWLRDFVGSFQRQRCQFVDCGSVEETEQRQNPSIITT